MIDVSANQKFAINLDVDLQNKQKMSGKRNYHTQF